MRPEVADWTCDHCGDEFWKDGLGAKPDGWRCLACTWVERSLTVADKLLAQVWPEQERND